MIVQVLTAPKPQARTVRGAFYQVFRNIVAYLLLAVPVIWKNKKLDPYGTPHIRKNFKHTEN